MEIDFKVIKLFVLILFFVSILVFSVGQNFGSKKAEKKYEVEIQKLEEIENNRFKESNITDFLEQFFTFETTGSNYDSYEQFMTTTAKDTQIKGIEKAKQTGTPQSFTNSRYLSSENYIRVIDDVSVSVISIVHVTADMVNSEGKLVTRGIENTVTVETSFILNLDDNIYYVSELNLE